MSISDVYPNPPCSTVLHYFVPYRRALRAVSLIDKGMVKLLVSGRDIWNCASVWNFIKLCSSKGFLLRKIKEWNFYLQGNTLLNTNGLWRNCPKWTGLRLRGLLFLCIVHYIVVMYIITWKGKPWEWFMKNGLCSIKLTLSLLVMFMPMNDL